MKINSYKIVFVLLVTSLSSCELIVDVDVPYDKDKLVTNALQRPDSTWIVDLTRTNFILSHNEDFYFPVDQAEVVIQNADGTTERLVLSAPGTGRFRGSSYPQPGQTYKITITPIGLDGVEAEMTMPTVIPIVNVEWDSTDVDNTRFYSDVPFKVTFKDPPGVKNFYEVLVFTYTFETYCMGPGPEDCVSDTVARVATLRITDAGITSKNERTSRFSDQIFDGQTYTASFNTQLVQWGQMPIIKVELWFATVSEEYFKYKETQTLQLDVMGDPFAQPVPVFSNISNGFGIFAGNAYDIRTYKP